MIEFKPKIKRALRSSARDEVGTVPHRDPLAVMLQRRARLAQGLLDEGFSKGTAESYASQMIGGFKTQKEKPRSRRAARTNSSS